MASTGSKYNSRLQFTCWHSTFKNVFALRLFFCVLHHWFSLISVVLLFVEPYHNWISEVACLCWWRKYNIDTPCKEFNLIRCSCLLVESLHPTVLGSSLIVLEAVPFLLLQAISSLTLQLLLVCWFGVFSVVFLKIATVF